MRNKTPQSFGRRPHSIFLVGALLIVAAVMAAPLHSVQSSSVARFSQPLENKLQASVNPSSLPLANLVGKRSVHLNLASPSATHASFGSMAALLLQPAPTESLAVFAGDCVTPQSSWTLGLPVCVKVANAPIGSAVLAARRVQFGGPEGMVRQSFDVIDDFQTFNFTLPSTPTSTVGGVTLDNRGTWSITLVDEEAGARDVAAIVVHDVNQAVADLQISKTLSSGSFTAGSNVSYLVFITNQGPDAATSVQFTDNTMPNTSFVSFTQNSGPSFNCTSPSAGSPGTTTCTAASMAANTTGSFTAVYEVSGSVGEGAEISDTASISSSTADQFPSSNDTDTTTEASNPTPPSCTITCPSNITKVADTVNSEGQLGAIVTFGDAETTGDCGSGPTTSIPASGSFFAIGSSVVTTTTGSGQGCSFTVTVTDNGSPVISCPQPITVEESAPGSGSATVTYSVTATDNSGVANVSCDKPSGSSFNVGTTTVQCTATDDANNSDTCSFDVTVTANTSACTLTGPTSPIVVDSPANACGANVTFDVESAGGCGTITCNRASGSFFGVGDTLVSCTSSSGGGSTSFTVTVNDVSDPVPNVATLPTVTRACSATVDPPTATDNCGGTIAGNTNDPRTYDEPGTYTVHWTYTDNSGNATSQDQTVIVQADTSGPVPDVATLPTVTGECSATVTATPTATDNCSGTDVAGTTNDPLTYTGAGTYTIHWTYTDGAGNSSQQNQTVVVTDSSAPTIALVGPASVTVECHTSFTDQGVTTTDNCVPKNVTVTTSGSVDVNTPGTYTLTYTATDGGSNQATAQRTVTVVDTTAPVITRNGASSMTVECHTLFGDPGATASDSCDSSVPVVTTGSVNVNVPGTYTLSYNAADDSGNSAAQVTRTVTVVDTTAPVITRNGASSMTVECHTSFSDPGASAADLCDSSVPVVTTGSVNVNVPGTYTLSYNAADDSGNAAATVTRTVTVVDTTAPTITVTGQTLSMWPPNHKYQTFQLTTFVTGVSDSCDTGLGVSSVVIEKVTSDETENGNGDGNTSNDIIIAANCKSVQLRSERQGGGDGRVYTITFKVTDASGQVGRATSKVVVPPNPGQTVVDSGPNYTVNGTCP